MSDQAHWEARFVNRFVVKQRQPRYKTCLPNEKDRHSALERLNHKMEDFEADRIRKLTGLESQAENILKLLQGEKVDGECWILSSDPALDGRKLALDVAVGLVASADWGTVMICPPKPIAIYRPEAPSSLYLLK